MTGSLATRRRKEKPQRAPARRSVRVQSAWYAPGATGCFPSHGKIRVCVCSKRATRSAALLASEGALPGCAALLSGAPGHARPALPALAPLGLRRILLPPAVAHDATTETLPSIKTPPADHRAQ